MRLRPMWGSMPAALGAAAILAVLPRSAAALALDPREIALTVESTLIDFDAAMIATHAGPSPASGLRYSSRIDEDGWAGRLYGDYGGREVDIHYTGVLAPVGGASNAYGISYTSDWRFDGATGSGSGAAVYTDPDFDFDIDFVNMEVSGSVSVSYGVATLSLSGSKNLTDAMLTVTGTASAFDLPLVGSAADASLSFSYDQITGRYSSDVEVNVLGGWLYSDTRQVNRGGIRRPPPPPPPPPPPLAYPEDPPDFPYPPGGAPGGFPATGPGYSNATVATVPLPPAALLLGAALLGLVGMGACHQGGADRARV